MSGFSFDSNIIIDALRGVEQARVELQHVSDSGIGQWISRVVWIEVLSKGDAEMIRRASALLGGFAIDELDEEIAARTAALRRERAGLRLPDAVILATAQSRGRILITRNTRDFPAALPGIRVPYTI